MESRADAATLRRLIEAGSYLLSELDPDAVLSRILEEARELTQARYAALGVLSEDRSELAQFLTLGMDEETERRIGDRPRGGGVLGLLIRDPRALILDDVGAHPKSFGFPPGHPPMPSFLGVPILVRGRAWGNLYLTEKRDGEPFGPADLEAVEILTGYAATAIENARLYASLGRERQRLSRAVQALEAARGIADAVGIEPDLDLILELIVKRGRAIVEARSVLILLRDGDRLRVVAGAGGAQNALGHDIPVFGSTSGEVLQRGAPVRVSDARHRLRIPPSQLGVDNVETALIVPMSHRSEALGVLVAFDRGEERADFSAQDEELLRTFAAAAANAVALSRSVEAERLRTAISSAEVERQRWARELHDQTLQSIAGVRMLLSSAEESGRPEDLAPAVRQAVDDLDYEVHNLRGIIADLRPSSLDDLGLLAALEALIERRRDDGLEIATELGLDDAEGHSRQFPPQLETTIYRLVQEALTNVVKHAHAAHAWVQVRLEDRRVTVSVRDDGIGFDSEVSRGGFGLTGIRERVFLAGGSVTLRSDGGGTELFAELPLTTFSFRSRRDSAPPTDLASARPSASGVDASGAPPARLTRGT
ncbi:MAG TPA: GAF domain-containing sensor histidine kinase [Solirubrobacteraceae bacterium]|nr:GAF domain-containing sensor histidine kinase [Solirubrobacteraceae bacterium]